MATTITAIKKKLEKVFDERQATVLAGVLVNSYGELVKTSDFTELKGIVKELAVAQKGTEVEVKELAEAQKRTEQRVEELTEAYKRMEETMNVGFKSLSDQIAALGSRWGL